MDTNARAARSDAGELFIPSYSLGGNAMLAILKSGQNRTRRRMETILGAMERMRSGSIMALAVELLLLLLVMPLVAEVRGELPEDEAAAASLEMVVVRRWVAVLSVMVHCVLFVIFGAWGARSQPKYFHPWGRRKHLITQLIRAARGRWSPSTGAVAGSSNNASSAPPPPSPPSTKLPLPCFALQRHHFGKLAGSSSGSSASVNSGRFEVATPSDFHSHLCKRIQNARERVILASLYIGVGSSTSCNQTSNSSIIGGGTDANCKEDELLKALHMAACNNNKLKKMQVLLDANRALRNVSFTKKNRQSHGSSSRNSGHAIQTTNSAEAVFSRLNPYLDNFAANQNNGLFLFPVNDQRLCTILPSPLDEVAGVFHIKAYIVDDELILSGANLSEEYFSNRLDRYMLFTNGGGGLVDFYANLCDILCEYAVRYDGHSNNKKSVNNFSSLFSLQDEKDRKEKLELSLMHLFDGKNSSFELEEDVSDDQLNPTAPIVAYAIPTFQMPTSFLGRSFRFQSDTEVTRNLLSSALNSEQSASVRLSSAYLNLTPKLLSVLSMYGGKGNTAGPPYILTAGAISHGFAPKARSQKTYIGIVDKIKANIPEAFLALVKETAQSIIARRGKVLLYERPGWTFHAKGIWITANGDGDDSHHRPEMINNPSSLLTTIVGSGNYGARSEDLDVESNCVIVFNDSNRDENSNTCTIKKSITTEWNNMCELSNELTDVKVAKENSKVMRLVLELLKRFL
ncbi:hypothetical protein ACHAXR_008467 [Thalassiosira sp. AJA248-18]